MSFDSILLLEFFIKTLSGYYCRLPLEQNILPSKTIFCKTTSRTLFNIKDMIMKMTKIATVGALAISLAGLSACNNMMPQKNEAMKTPMHSQSMAKMNVVQVAQSNPEFSLLVEAVQAAGLVGMLSDPNAHYTIFAPTNDAFAQALTETGMTKAQLFGNKALLNKILGYHVISGAMPIYAKDVKQGNVTMVSKDTLMVTANGKLVDETGRTATLLKTDIAATNGVVHVIDKVLMPK
jgi:uncharacterized surface protein with fasciclin (FAS1) repeats